MLSGSAQLQQLLEQAWDVIQQMCQPSSALLLQHVLSRQFNKVEEFWLVIVHAASSANAFRYWPVNGEAG